MLTGDAKGGTGPSLQHRLRVIGQGAALSTGESPRSDAKLFCSQMAEPGQQSWAAQVGILAVLPWTGQIPSEQPLSSVNGRNS